MPSDAATRHGRPLALVSYVAIVERPIPGRDFIVRGTAQRAPCKAGFSGQSSRRTTQGVSRTGVDAAS